MFTHQLDIILITAVTAAACAIPGVFLVLRRMAMMSDAISHVVLLGIVLAFFVTADINSPLLTLGAAAMGLVTVTLVELLNRTRLIKEDAAIGLVFPFLFSIAVILISRYAGDVHLDTDAVLLGSPEFAPFDRFILFDFDFGPTALVEMSTILALNALFIFLFYKELKLATFDAGLAAALGFAPGFIHYALMGLVSVTAVGAFDAVGSVLVVALMVAPPATAYLITDRLGRMIGLSALFGVLSALGGVWLAYALDASISGSMAAVSGLIFGVAFLLAPERGIIAIIARRARQRQDFAMSMLAIHLLHHEGLPSQAEESRVGHLHRELRWSEGFAAQVVSGAERAGLVTRRDGSLSLTERGREAARSNMVQS